MTAETCYVDSSALRQIYVHDRHSALMAAWRFRHPGAIPITRFTRVELINSMAAAVQRRHQTAADLQDFLSDLAVDLAMERLRLLDVPWRKVLDDAAELSRQYTLKLGTRSLDVLHVACARELGLKGFLTYDARQAALAAACGLKVIRP